MTTSVSVSIDVPALEAGVRFYCDVFGFIKTAEPAPGVAILSGLNIKLCLLEKREGSKPSPRAKDGRHYVRHWTPVHLDFHVEDLQDAVRRAETAGAVAEQVFENPEHGSAAFCSDPFGNGFCIIQRPKQAGAAT